MFGFTSFSGKLEDGKGVPVVALFRHLRQQYNWKVEEACEVAQKLEAQDIVTAGLLREYWQREPVKRAAIPQAYKAALCSVLSISEEVPA